ncbi:MAG TPA: sugar ABC transporter permease, partial [Mesotoga infera]|nr:sugar ABC transporter permease [Mesotoga infera]
MTQSHSKSPRRFRREVGSWLFLLPHLFFFALFVVVPLVFGLVISFFNWSLLKENVFIGFNNY